jgi:nicotinate-nucleotide pyrophosphorylase (carboxylating)
MRASSSSIGPNLAGPRSSRREQSRTITDRLRRPRTRARAPVSTRTNAAAMERCADLAAKPARVAPPPHPTYSIPAVIRAALDEDVGDVGDVSSLSTIPATTRSTATLLAKASGILAGEHLSNAVLAEVDPELRVEWMKRDGDAIERGEVFMRVEGSARSILRAERVVLNFMQRMSGIATMTRAYAEKAAPATMLETRKTVPGLRVIDKWAVLIGGGKNHRIGLFDMVMIKDNHIAAAGGIAAAVSACEAYLAENGLDNVKIEVEARTMDEVKTVIALLDDPAVVTKSVTRLMLDNMSVADMKTAVGLIAGRLDTEASGNVTLDTVGDIGQTGVTFISSGALTHSVTALDISLNIDV